MDAHKPVFGSRTFRRLLDAHRGVTELKYLYLKIVESHRVRELDKVEFKGSLIELASSLNRYFSDLRFARINRFNIDEVEKSIEGFLRDTGRQAKWLRKSGSKLLAGKVRLRRIPVAEVEIDAALLSSRVLEAQGLEKDKLDYLNAIRDFLGKPAAGTRDSNSNAGGETTPADRELLELKVRNYSASLSDHKANNLDILCRVRIKTENALRDGTRINVLAGSLSVPGVLNQGELYIRDHDNGNYTISFRGAGVAFLLEILLVQELRERAPVYRGEISGWAETGPNRVDFFLEDSREVIGKEVRDPSGAEAVAAFLKKASFETVYSGVRQACSIKAGETDRLLRKVEQEMKQKVSDALDQVL